MEPIVIGIFILGSIPIIFSFYYIFKTIWSCCQKGPKYTPGTPQPVSMYIQ